MGIYTKGVTAMADVGRQVYYFNPMSPNPKIHVTSAGIVYPDSRYDVRKENLHSVLFEYVVRGSGHVLCGEGQFSLCAGDVCVLIPGRGYRYWADWDDPYEKLWFGARGDLVDRLLEAYDMHEPVWTAHADVRGEFEGLIESLRLRQYDSAFAARTVLNILLGAYESARGSSDTTPAQEIRSYIDIHILEKLTLQALSTRFSLSGRHLIRLFKARYGCTPIAYAARKKLAVAARYLIDTGYPVGVIAQRLGYCEQSYFSSEFRRVYGVYPTQYRRIGGAHPSGSAPHDDESL